MQLTSSPALSAFVLAAVGLVNAIPAAHNADIVQRSSSHHKAIARDLHVAAKRSSVAVPRTLQGNTKRSSKKEKRCRIRPTSSSALTDPTATSTQVSLPESTGTVGGTSELPATSSSAPPPEATVDFQSQWQLKESRQGSTFFDGWDFWAHSDPTHGNVAYLTRDEGRNQDLWGVGPDGVAYMKVSTQDWTINGNRPSIRLHDRFTWGVGTLVIMDAKHMPTGCGVWGAFWANGPNWPNGGEIDIVEGVHEDTQNKGTLHTRAGCSTSTDNVPPPSGQLLHSVCASSGSDNRGCGFTDVEGDNSFGRPFNENGGGTYAMRLDDAGLSMWFWPRGSEPDDVRADQPRPDQWHAPYASWSGNTCPTRSYFYDQIAIINTTLCGDWAGSSWWSSGCAEKTGVDTCSEYVRSHPEAFNEAYWAVNYVKYYQT